MATDDGVDATFPLRLWLCAQCGLAQLADDLEVPEDVQGDEPAALVAQRRKAVATLVDAAVLPVGGTVVEFSSPHGGSWLGLLAQQGIRSAASGEPADLVVDCCFGLMHEPDQRVALEQRAARLSSDGILLVQFHSLAAISEHLQWNAIRHGHFGYYSTPAMRAMLTSIGLTTVGAWWFPLYGGTVLLAASPDGNAEPVVSDLVQRELDVGVLDPGVLTRLQKSVGLTVAGLRDLVMSEHAAGRTVYGYSAASRAVSLLYLAGLDVNLLSGVADLSPAKHGRRMPGTTIPVISPEQLVEARPDVVLLFVSDLLDEVRAAMPEVEAAGGKWIDVGSGASSFTVNVAGSDPSCDKGSGLRSL